MEIKHDFHIHTDLSICANKTATLENYLNIAKNLDLKKIGIANHFWDSRIDGNIDFYKTQDFEHISKLKPEIEKASSDAGFTPNVIAKINDIACYRTMMCSGIAIGYRRDSSKDPENGLRYLNVTDLEMIQHMGIHYKKDADGTVKNFVEYLKTKSE